MHFYALEGIYKIFFSFFGKHFQLNLKRFFAFLSFLKFSKATREVCPFNRDRIESDTGFCTRKDMGTPGREKITAKWSKKGGKDIKNSNNQEGNGFSSI